MIYTSYEDMADVIRRNMWKIPSDIDIIVGIPRSGMIPAYMIAEYLNKQVTDIEQFAGEHQIAIGRRGIYRRRGKEGKVMIIDDTVYSGWAIDNARRKVEHLQGKYEILFACVYAEGKEAKEKVDIWLNDNSLLNGGKRYLYEWNIFQHVKSKGKWMMWDMDGLICKDPPDDRDTAAYEAYLPQAIPMIIPSNDIGAICTYRLEKYRAVTEKWLADNDVKVSRVIMFQAPNREMRNRAKQPAQYKAEEYLRATWAELFLESDRDQAERIHELTGKPVFCYKNGKMYK